MAWSFGPIRSLVLVAMLLPLPALAQGWASVRVFGGDYESDGDSDIYLLTGLSESLSLPYDIPVTIEVQSDVGDAIFVCIGDTDADTYPNYGVDHPITAGTPGVDGVDWQQGSFLPILGDLNGDGREDLFLQPRFAGDHLPGMISLAPLPGGHPRVDQYITPEALGLPVAADAVQIRLEDVDGDGFDDLILTAPLSAPQVRYGGDSGTVDLALRIPGTVETPAQDPGISDPLGALPGSVSVSAGGALQYQLPLNLPSGIASHSPSLALTYSSGSPNGHLGVGFSLSGPSAIHRCPRLTSPDTASGSVYGVTLGDQDEICLNGQRLVLVGGTHLRGGAVYRPEIDDFTRVSATGPNSRELVFTAEMRDGRVLELGGTADAQVEAVGVAADYQWLASRSTDRFGNEILYHYEEDDVSGEHRLSSISYDGARVQLLYDDERADGVTRYLAGGARRIDSRLREIQISLMDQPIRDYLLAYDAPSPATGRERLGSLTLCGYDLAGGERICLPPTEIEWNEPETAYDVDARSIPDKSFRLYVAQALDWNGDGVGDLLTGDLGRLRIRLGGRDAPGGDVSLFTSADTDNIVMTATAFDADGDGDDDVVYRVEAKAQIEPGINVCNGLDDDADGYVDEGCGEDDRRFSWHVVGDDGATYALPGAKWTGPPVYADLFGAAQATPIHIDADGRPDLLIPIREVVNQELTERWHLYRNESIPGVMAFAHRLPLEGLNTVSQRLAVAMDLEGDGPQELVVPVDDELHALSFPDAFATPRGAAQLLNLRIPAARAVFLDVNGDGLTDIASPSEAGLLTLHRNRGAGFEAIATGLDVSDIFVDYLDRTSPEDYVVKAFDYDGDGLSDLIYPSDGNDATYRVLLSTGEGFTPVDTGVPVHVVIVSGTESIAGEPPSECSDAQLEEIAYWENQKEMTLELYDTVDALCREGNEFYCIYRDVVIPLYLESINAELQSIYDQCVGGEGTDPVPRLLSSGSRDFHFFDVNGDGQGDIVQVDGSTEGDTWLISLQTRGEPDLVRAITDGHGARTHATYAPLTDEAVHTRSTGALFPTQDYAGAASVVSALERDNGVGGHNRVRFGYVGARHHLKGRGFLGFAEQRRIDEAAGLTSVTRTHQASPLTGAAYFSQQRSTETGILLTKREVAWDVRRLNGDLTRFPFAAYDLEERFELDGGRRSATAVERTYGDSYGNLTERITTVGTGVSGGEITGALRLTTERFTYENVPSAWLLGFQTRSHTTWSDLSGGENIDSVQSARRLPGALVPVERVQNVGSPVEVIQRIDYDARGRQIASTVSAESPGVDADRVREQGDFEAGRFPRLSVDALGHPETRRYDLRSEGPSATTDANGLSAHVTYDPFGRIRTTLATDLSRSYTTYRRCDATCPPLASYLVITASDGQPPTTTYRDRLDREIRVEVMAFDGRTLRSDLQYDALGRVVARSLPYYAGEAPQWTTTEYDLLGRPTAQLDPDGGSVATTYSSNGDAGGQRITRDVAVVAPGGATRVQTTVQVEDALGQFAEVLDPLGTPIHYRYDGRGRTRWIQVNADIDTTVELAYDVAGNKVWLSDPDAGELSYQYNGLGELRSQTDAKGQITRLTYDVLGRLVARVDDEGGALEERHTFTWDAAPFAIGQLVSASAPGFSERLFYDARGRLSSRETQLAERGAPLRQGFLFDSLGRPSATTYPSGLTVATVYNGQGYAAGALESTSGAPLWTVEEVGPFGQETSLLLGNGLRTRRVEDPRNGRLLGIRTEAAGGSGEALQDLAYTYDTVGSLHSRADRTQDLREDFGYDALNRLTSAVTTGLASGTRSLSYSYDALGNILTRTGVAGTYFYGQGGAGPHAVTAAGGHTYRYDANGNMVEGAGRGVAWSAFNKPTRIARGDATSEFRYGPDRLRFLQTLTTDAGTTRTYYLDGGMFEEVHQPDGTVTQRTYLGSHVLHTQVLDAAGRPQGAARSYLHRDHLGSVDVITDGEGAVVERLAFGPFGERRTGAWAQDGAPGETTPRGFTGHEHLDGVGLIHMNGRVYDPALGRFMSADPMSFSEVVSQDYNRYSYTRNSPTSLNDPSGYSAAPLVSSILNVITSPLRAIARTLSQIFRAPTPQTPPTPTLQAATVSSTNQPMQAKQSVVFRPTPQHPMFNTTTPRLPGSPGPGSLSMPNLFPPKVDPMRVDTFRADDEENAVGRKGTWVEPGGFVSTIIADHIAFGNEFGQDHDISTGFLVDKLKIPDIVANIPTMPALFTFSVVKGSLSADRPDYFKDSGEIYTGFRFRF